MIGQYTLSDTDGRLLSESTIMQAFFRQRPAYDVVKLGISDVIDCACRPAIIRILAPLPADPWHNDIIDMALDYADHILHDWLTFGQPGISSLCDVIEFYIEKIKSDAPPLVPLSDRDRKTLLELSLIS